MTKKVILLLIGAVILMLVLATVFILWPKVNKNLSEPIKSTMSISPIKKPTPNPDKKSILKTIENYNWKK